MKDYSLPTYDISGVAGKDKGAAARACGFLGKSMAGSYREPREPQSPEEEVPSGFCAPAQTLSGLAMLSLCFNTASSSFLTTELD